jgi:ATP-dependent Clp protease protease subunit
MITPVSNYIVPTVIESEGRSERAYDIYSRLLKDRIIFLGSEVNDQVANIIIAQFLFLQMQDPKKDIHFYINSPGGSVTAGLAIYDTMQFVTCDVNTYCIGICASMGAVLLAAGTKGKRFALPNSDVERTVDFMYKLKRRLNRILALHCGKTPEVIEKDADRDNYMSAEEACTYGLVDKVLQSNRDLPAKE